MPVLFFFCLSILHYNSRPRSVPAVGVIFAEPRGLPRNIKKRDVKKLYRTLKKRSPLKLNPEFVAELEYIKESAIYDLEQEYTRLGLPSYSEIKYAVKKKRPETVNFLTGSVITDVEFYSVAGEIL